MTSSSLLFLCLDYPLLHFMLPSRYSNNVLPTTKGCCLINQEETAVNGVVDCDVASVCSCDYVTNILEMDN